MPKLTQTRLQAYHAETFRLKPGQQLKNLQDAVDFVNQRGFVYFWPIKGIDFPSLWTAVAGDRPVADAHDDPGHITWGWKDDALGKGLWYYGKILRKKATMIALETAPLFYALSENYGDPEEDVRIQYQEGHLTLEAKSIFDVLVENGPMDTIAIRRATHMTSSDSNSRFERALALLQADFKILPAGISDAGAWHYAFIYDLTHRHYPQIMEKARPIKERAARMQLVEYYFKAVGAAGLRNVVKLFQWKKSEVSNAIDSLVDSGILVDNVIFEQDSTTIIALKELV